MIHKIDSSPTFYKITQACQCLLTFMFMTPRRTYLPNINTLACYIRLRHRACA